MTDTEVTIELYISDAGLEDAEQFCASIEEHTGHTASVVGHSNVDRVTLIRATVQSTPPFEQFTGWLYRQFDDYEVWLTPSPPNQDTTRLAIGPAACRHTDTQTV